MSLYLHSYFSCLIFCCYQSSMSVMSVAYPIAFYLYVDSGKDRRSTSPGCGVAVGYLLAMGISIKGKPLSRYRGFA